MPAPLDSFPWLSIIIPTLNEVTVLPDCLRSVYAEAVSGQFEVIVADGGSTDGTIALTARYPALTTLHCTRGRARQLNAGARLARGKYLWLLHADTQPPDGWFELLQNAARVGNPATFSVRFSQQEQSALLRLYARGSKIDHWSVRFGDQSLFIGRKLFTSLNGYREDHLLMEGHELARRVMKAGPLTLLPASVTTSSRRYQAFGIIYTQAVFSLIFALYYLGVPQQHLLRLHRSAFRGGV